MHDIFDSVRRSFTFLPPTAEDATPSPAGTLADKINSRIRRSRAFSKPSKFLLRSPSPPPPLIRWRKGDLIGCGAFGRVYMGMNLDSGELLAVKEVLIASGNGSREKAQAHIKDLEEEVYLLKNLSHPNIVRYLGTVREDNSLNILLEFVPGGSISSLLGKFGPFPEPVIQTYTKQLLLGLDYLHKSEIMHRDIKGANILVDNTGCIKLADFGASKKVAELATMSGAKSMKGTPYWMAPEVILQTGHSFSADIWSVGCTVIEMATGKPPWSDQYQEVAALFHIGSTKSHPPIPEHLSAEGKDFLLKCLHREPKLRPTAAELLQHPFVAEEQRNPLMECSHLTEDLHKTQMIAQRNPKVMQSCSVDDGVYASKANWETRYSDDNNEMCLIDDMDEFPLKLESASTAYGDLNQSFNPISEPSDVWMCNAGESCKLKKLETLVECAPAHQHARICVACKSAEDETLSSFCPSLSEEDVELTESKIKEFLEEKVIELKKLYAPLYEELFNALNGFYSPNPLEDMPNDGAPTFLKLPPKSQSPGQVFSRSPMAVDSGDTASPSSVSRCLSNISNTSNQTSPDVTPPQCKVRQGLDVNGQCDSNSPSMSFSDIQRKWKEELDQELARRREKIRQSGVIGKASSPIDKSLRKKERSRLASAGR